MDTYGPHPYPNVRRTHGGVCIANQGSTSDEQGADLASLLNEVNNAACGEHPKVLLAVDDPLSAFFAPADPLLRPRAGAILWILNPETLAGSGESPKLLQLLLRQLHTIRQANGEEFTQIVYLPELASPQARILAEVITTLGVSVRRPDPETGCVLMEVHRPEGIVISGLSGTQFVPPEPPQGYELDINLQKDRAERHGDTTTLKRLEALELETLTDRLAPARPSEPPPVDRAMHLRRLLLAAYEGGQDARQALFEELLRRETPLLLFIDPQTGGVAQRSWPGRGAAMPVYPDRSSLAQTATDVGIPLGSLTIAQMAPRKIFQWMAGKTPLAVNVFRDHKTPLYLWLHLDEVQALSEGKLPTLKVPNVLTGPAAQRTSQSG